MMTTEARWRCGIMGMAYKVGGVYGWKTIAAVNMRDNMVSGNRDTGRW